MTVSPVLVDSSISQPLLEASGLSKTFGIIEVLKDISLTVRAGEVHAIIGENGAGKSTLMKILAGNHQPTRGEIRIDGAAVSFSGPVDAEDHGIVLVHQEILLAPDLTVAQNIYLGRELRKGLVVDDQAMRSGARQAIVDLGGYIDPDTTGGVSVRMMLRTFSRRIWRVSWWGAMLQNFIPTGMRPRCVRRCSRLKGSTSRVLPAMPVSRFVKARSSVSPG